MDYYTPSAGYPTASSGLPERNYEASAASQPSNLLQLVDSKNYFNPDMTLRAPLDKMNVVALFYRDGCPHCDHYKPTFAKAAAQEPNTLFLLVNTAEEPYVMELLNKRNAPFSIRGVPTIVSFNKGKFFSKFGGDRTVENTVQYARTIGAVKPEYNPNV